MTTENIRLLLVILLSFVGLLLWEAWQRDYAPRPTSEPVALETPPISTPAVPTPTPATPPATASATPATSQPPLKIETDILALEVNPVGGVLQKLTLLKYVDSADKNLSAHELLSKAPDKEFLAEAGLKGAEVSADHYTLFESPQTSYALAPGQDVLEVPLRWRSSNGLVVTRTLVFRRGSYAVEERFDVQNTGSSPWTFNHYQQLKRLSIPAGWELVPTFNGVAVSTPEQHYGKHNFDDLNDQPIDVDVTAGWIAVVEHYFLAALIPDPAVKQHFYSYALTTNRYIVGYYGPAVTVPSGGSATVSNRLYLGPKLQETLPTIAPGLELTVDYGVLWFIAQFLFSVLKILHTALGNWGWSIVILTVLIKLAFYPLSAAGYRSMARMRAVQPRLLQLRERYAEDKAKLNQAMMEMYKQEKINPLGGCFPILVQIPVFISLYWMILESIELRQAPFLLWIHDLSAKDPFYVLPALMLISMVIQTRLNPTPPDPIQAKVMQIMPIAFGVFFAFFPAGLVLYWLVNNVLSISQQWYITRQIEKAAG